MTTGGASGATLRLSPASAAAGCSSLSSMTWEGTASPSTLSRTARRSGQPFLLHHDQAGGREATIRSPGWTSSGRTRWPAPGAEAEVDLSALEYLRLRMRFEGVRSRSSASRARSASWTSCGASSAAPDPASLRVPLYDFQETGYRWLWFPQQNDFGGLLCDEMGLGKTHQAMAPSSKPPGGQLGARVPPDARRSTSSSAERRSCRTGRRSSSGTCRTPCRSKSITAPFAPAWPRARRRR